MTVTHPAPAPARAWFVAALDQRGEQPALVGDGFRLSYAALATLVREAAERLGPQRRLVLLSGPNTLDTVVTYLGALAGGHVVALAPGGGAGLEALVDTYDPDVVGADGPGGWRLEERRAGTAHPDLHPDLALLLSTSGSTGSPKLVRLSWQALQANADSIAQALAIGSGDRVATTLPLHYSFGLSLLHSHLAAGASLVLTGLSVVDPCFWELFERERGTTLAGVPHTFELLDRVGFASMELPHLRALLQAGGRLRPDRVREYAALGRERGWDLFVMYGQTEATARMAVLPPDLALDHPQSIGLPIPGGSFAVETTPGHEAEPGEVGELVYSGPNVMMGYAHSPADLGRGADLSALRTGDLARRTADGLYEVVGRRSRFAKIVGLRVDLDHLERLLGERGLDARCADAGSTVVVSVPSTCDERALAAELAQQCGIPARSVLVRAGRETPLLPSGKPDYPAIAALAAAAGPDGDTPPAPRAGHPGRVRVEQVVALYAELLGRPDATARSSFVALGGDSLSYVEVSLRLEQLLGALPGDWHLRPVAELAELAEGASSAADGAGNVPAGRPGVRPGWRVWRGWRQVETGIVLRAVAVLLILANHTHLADVPGGAHTLLLAAGWNFARFQLTSRDRSSRVRGILRSATRVFVPSAVWIGGLALVSDGYSWHNALMLQQVLGDHAQWSDRWHFWFIEVLLYFLVVLAGLLAIPAVDRAERRWPFGLALGLVGVGLLSRYAVVVPDAGPYRGATAYVLVWLFALGWAAHKAGTTWQRLLVSGLVIATVPGFWADMPGREATIIGGALALLWLPSVRLPRRLGLLAGTIASASLYIYLTHFLIYPPLMAYSSPLAMAACVVFGVGYWKAVLRAGQVAGPVRSGVSTLARLVTGRRAEAVARQRKADSPVSA